MTDNTAWQLEDFVDSLVVELDKTRETLAVKAVNKPLSYTVKELALDLNTFPSYDGEQIRFLTAQPGQEGASKVTISLNSITDQQVRATTKLPRGTTDVTIDQIDVDQETRKKLRKLGVSSVDDLEQLQERDVDLGQVSGNDIDYTMLAKKIQKSRRNQSPPTIGAVSLSVADDDGPCLLIEGRHLGVDPAFQPVAVVNEVLADVLATSDRELLIQLAPGNALRADNDVVVAFDQYAVVKVNVRT
ncbi:hypothetical protein [Streptomyces ureilyticus]|uniref:Uncharacterized protein n=1 Tax=Streptomyces ureilyticus TaxID=1775131 RepID=A0ABX0E446_9ACTN|nr:hypothetical protein [Streptomyces ureilyticus]NGO48988.1 hypothetical protein [Streptomyces ureilyticus]